MLRPSYIVSLVVQNALLLLGLISMTAAPAAAIKFTRGPCLGVAFSSDGQQVLCGYTDAEVRLQTAEGGDLIHQYTKQTGYIAGVAVSSDGKFVASTSQGSVEVWDARTGLLKHVFTKRSGYFFAVAISPDGKRVAGGGYCLRDENSHGTVVGAGVTSYEIVGDVCIWNVDSGSETELRAAHDAHENVVQSIAFSADGGSIAVAKGGVALWDARSGEVIHTYRWPGSGVLSVAFSGDGQTLVGGGWFHTDPHSTGEVCVWDVASGEIKVHIESTSQWMRAAAISRDERLVASGSEDGTAKLWSMPDGSLLHSLGGKGSEVYGVAFSADGSRLACANLNGTVTQWSTSSGAQLCVGEAPAFPSGIAPYVAKNGEMGGRSVAYAADGSFLVTAGGDQSVRCWDTRTGKLRWCINSHYSSVYGVAVSPNGQVIASGSWDRLVRLWDIASGKCILTLSPGGDVDSVAFSPESSSGSEPMIATSSHRDRDGFEVNLWDFTTGQLLHTLSGHINVIPAIAFTPDGLILASCSYDGTVKLWDPQSGALMRTLKALHGIDSMAISNDGALLATGEYGCAEVWDLATGKVTATMPWPKGGIYGIGFSPDSKLVLGGGFHEGDEIGPASVIVWDAKTGAQRNSLSIPTRWIHCLAVSPTEHLAAVGCDDGAVVMTGF